MFCSKCGTQNDNDSSFCEQCGAAITVANLTASRQEVAVSKGSKKRIISIVVALFLVVILGVTSYYFVHGNINSNGLFPVNQNGKYGYLDKTGKIIIPLQFDYASDFREGMAGVEIGGKYGFIDKSGKIAINPQFDYPARFGEGLAAVKIGDKAGYIDKAGKTVINPQFGDAWEFGEGLAAVKIGDKWGYIDKSGKIVINPQFEFASPFGEGLAVVIIGDKRGYIDKTGKIVINPQFALAWPFSDGLASVNIGDKWGYIDKTGRIVINPQFAQSFPFGKGLAAVKIGDKWGFINKTGKIVINPQFDEPGEFGERWTIVISAGGMTTVRVGSGISGEALAAVKIGNKWGYIDKSGKFVINLQFDTAEPFDKGLASVRLGDKIGYIDKTGKFIWPSGDKKQSTSGKSGGFIEGILNKISQSLSSLPTESLAKEVFEQDLQKQGNGCLKLVEFNKINGIEQNMMGQKLYEIDYSATVETIEECYLDITNPNSLSAASVRKWASEDHRIFGQQMEPMWGRKTAVGITRKLSGKYLFIKTEKGWQRYNG